MRVLIVGDYAHPDFSVPRAWLQRNVDLAEAPTIQTALEHVRAMLMAPSTIVLAQSRPGQLSTHDVDVLHRAAPLARVVALLGTWCEGEPRSGHPWPGVPRVYWYQWQTRLVRELTSPRLRVLPRTATPAEQLFQVMADIELGAGPIAIHTPQRASFEALADAVRMGGYSAAWCRPGDPLLRQNVTAAIFDTTNVDAHVAHELARVAQQTRPAPLVVLIGYPRRYEIDQALAAGAATVVAKPFLVADLLGELARSAGSAASPVCRPGRAAG